jgi:hypothetical protein
MDIKKTTVVTYTVAATDIGTSSFNATMLRVPDTTFGGTTYYGFSWIAWKY